MDSEGTRKGDGVGLDAIQTSQIKVYGAEEREGGIPTISEKPVKSLGKVFDSSERSIQSTCTELDG